MAYRVGPQVPSAVFPLSLLECTGEIRGHPGLDVCWARSGQCPSVLASEPQGTATLVRRRWSKQIQSGSMGASMSNS